MNRATHTNELQIRYCYAWDEKTHARIPRTYEVMVDGVSRGRVQQGDAGHWTGSVRTRTRLVLLPDPSTSRQTAGIGVARGWASRQRKGKR